MADDDVQIRFGASTQAAIPGAYAWAVSVAPCAWDHGAPWLAKVTAFGGLASLSISQKIRRAMLGTAGERMLLVRDRNKLVSSAAIRSPKIGDNEIALIPQSRSVSDDVLRIIATNKVWVQDHQIKLNLVYNPRTPFVFSAKLVAFLREAELKQVAKSKNVSAAIAQAARQHLARRKK